MILKIIKIYGKKNVIKKDSWGKVKLYPKGTIRKVKILSCKGIHVVKQKAKISIITDFSGLPFSYINKWKTL